MASPDLPALSAVSMSVSDAVATIRFGRPATLNAANEQLLLETLKLLYAIEARDEIGAVVLTSGGEAFSSGFDLSEVPAGDEQGTHEHFRMKALYYHAVIHMLARIAKPTLAAVNGPAVGGGLGMVLACDLAVAVSSATFLPAWMTIGIGNDAGTSFFLSRIVGYRRAMEWLLTNRTLSAREALEWGVLNAVYEPGRFGQEVGRLAGELASGPSHIQGMIKNRVQEGSSQSLEDCTEHEIQNVMRSVDLPYFQQRLQAFATKTARSNLVYGQVP